MSLEKVAKAAGVSVATVSRVLSGSDHPVSADTRARVLATAGALDFQPNLLARSLVTARTNVIGAIVHDISDPYFAEIVRGLEDEAIGRDHRVFVCSSDRDPSRELAYLRALLGHRVDAIVLVGGEIRDPAYRSDLHRLLDAHRAGGGTVVLLAPHSYPAPSAGVDNTRGAEAMTKHLLELGHRTIGHIGGPRHVRTSAMRLNGYRRALEEAGMTFEPGLVVDGRFTVEGGRAAAAELLERRPEVTAIFAANDVMAFGAMRAAADRGLRIPDDLSLAGFDDVQPASFAMTPLTTVRVPMRELGRAGVELALQDRSGSRPRSRVLPTEVVIRSSTARPRSVR